MKYARIVAMTLGFLLRGVASAEYDALRVDVNPALGTLRYEAPGMASGSLGCGDDPFVCTFGLELDMRLQLDGLGKAHATVNTLELHGLRGMFAEYPDTVDFLELNLRSFLTTNEFVVTPGAGPDETIVTGSFPLSEPLVLQFHRARLMTMSGGPDLRPVDGPRYTFAYTVPEPGTLAMAAIAGFSVAGTVAARRRR